MKGEGNRTRENKRGRKQRKIDLAPEIRQYIAKEMKQCKEI